MAITHYLTATPVDPPTSRDAAARAGSISFFGSVRMHPYDSRKLVLVPYPYSAEEGVFEFSRDDVVSADGSSEVVSQDGNTLTVMRIYIRSGSHAVNLKPFTVSST